MDNNLSNNLRNLPEDMVLCRWCKEPIMATDKICKHCNEYQKHKDIIDSERNLLKDPTLSVFDWITILFFQLLGILLGFVHNLRGEKKRSSTLILYSFISILFNISLGYSIFRFHGFLIKMIKNDPLADTMFSLSNYIILLMKH